MTRNRADEACDKSDLGGEITAGCSCAAAACGRLGQRLRQLAAGVRRVDHLVDHADLDGAVDAAGDPLVLGGQLLVQRLTLVLRSGGQLLRCRMPTAALAPITATSAPGQAKTLVAPSEREFIAM